MTLPAHRPKYRLLDPFGLNPLTQKLDIAPKSAEPFVDAERVEQVLRGKLRMAHHESEAARISGWERVKILHRKTAKPHIRPAVFLNRDSCGETIQILVSVV